MKFVITKDANNYVEYLSQCLELLPQENLPYAQTLYQAWQILRETQQLKLAESQQELEQPKFEPIQRFVY